MGAPALAIPKRETGTRYRQSDDRLELAFRKA